MTTLDSKELIQNLQSRFDDVAQLSKKDWWERYMKYEIEFRGVNLIEIRKVLRRWYQDYELGQWTQSQQSELALALFREHYAEDKLAGILFFQEYLLDIPNWKELLESFEALFTEGHIYDWNVCDWFCVRVLGVLIERHGIVCGKAIAKWSNAENLWQARASLVAFVNHAKKKAEPTLEIKEMILAISAILIAREERFAKTAVGWVLRELSTAYPEDVISFVKPHEALFSKESLKNAMKHLST